MNLYELTSGYLEILNMSDDSDIDEKTIADTLESIEEEINEKADNYVRLIKALEGDCLVLEDLISKTQKKYTKKLKIIDYLKQNLFDSMNRLGEKNIKTKFADVKIVNNGGMKPLRIDEENVPDEYIKIIPEIDKQKIRKDIESGIELSFAHLEERGQHLAIK